MTTLEKIERVGPGKRAASILVVEDELLVAKDLSQTLEELGYQVFERVSTGEEGIKRTLARQPDLVLMDIHLPGGIDGIQAAEAIRYRSDLPVVFLTAFSDAKTLERAKKVIPYGYLVKPFNKSELRCTIEVALSRREEEKAQEENRRNLARNVDNLTTKLRLAEQRYQTLIDNANDSIWILDPDGVILEVNKAAAKMIGIPKEKIAGLHFTQFAKKEEVGARILDFEEFLKKGFTRLERIKVQRPDGQTRLMDLSSALVQVGSETLVMTLGMDVTLYRQMESEKIQLQKMELLGRMAAAIAHDFNNILNVINLHVQLLEEQVGEHETYLREGLGIIHSSSHHGVVLTKQLLSFGKPPKFKPEPQNINALIGDTLPLVRCFIGNGAELIKKLDPNLGQAILAEGHFSQILLNLAANAKDAMSSDAQLTIETANQEVRFEKSRGPDSLPAGSFVMLAVGDNGCGMDCETLKRIFEPFFTTKSKDKGTGLGLSTVFDLVHQNQGHIRVESQPGKGTTFRLYFPRI